MEKSLIVFILSLLLLYSSCSLSKQERVQWVVDYNNGLHKRVNSGDYSFDLQYKPDWFLSLVSPNTNGVADTSFQHYVLDINVNSSSQTIEDYSAHSIEGMQDRKYYFTYLFDQDLFLIDGNDKLPCLIFHYESSGGVNPKSRFILGFEKRPLSKEATLVIQSDYLNSVPIKIKIFKNTP